MSSSRRKAPTRVKPDIFIPLEEYTLKEVLLERYEHFDIYWYHWPRDGTFGILGQEDYEPVIIIYGRDRSICRVITRRHWKYQSYSKEELTLPLQILFDGEFHPPIPKTIEKENEFELKKYQSQLPFLNQQYDIILVKDTDIDIQFRTGQGHLTSFGRIVEGPTIKAKESYKSHCSS